MNSCIVRNKHFSTAAKRNGISEDALYHLAMAYINDSNIKGEVKKDFPSDDWILAKLHSNVIMSGKNDRIQAIQCWKEIYSQPIVMTGVSDATLLKAIDLAKIRFGENSVHVSIQTKDGVETSTIYADRPLIHNPENKAGLTYVGQDIATYEYDMGVFERNYNKSEFLKRRRVIGLENAELMVSEWQKNHPTGVFRITQAKNNAENDEYVVTMNMPDLNDLKYSLYTIQDEGTLAHDKAFKYSKDVIPSESILDTINNVKIDKSGQFLLFQKSLLEELNKLKALDHTLKSLGSNKKIATYIKNSGVNPVIATTIIKAIEIDPKLKELKAYDLFNIISKLLDSDLALLYDKYLQLPIDKKLEEHLANFLNKYHILIQENPEFLKKYGVAGAFDILNKIIYIAKSEDRNALTVPEEVAHALVELMGTKVVKDTITNSENRDYTFLYNEVENTSIYKLVFEEYKDIYTTEEGKPDIAKIKKEAIGQALAVAIKNKWDNKIEEEATFWQKLKEWFMKIINMFTNTEYINFDALINKIAADVVSNNHDRFKKVDDENYSLLNYAETIANLNKQDGGKALKFMLYFSEKGNIITGSLRYRYQGTVYRSALDALHDIDMVIPASTHKIDFNSLGLKNVLTKIHKGSANEIDTRLRDYLIELPYFKKIKKDYPKIKFLAGYPGDKGTYTINAIYCENEEISQRFAMLRGSYATRLNTFTEEERKQIYLFNFFLDPRENIDSIYDDKNNIYLSTFELSFQSKLKMGRAKDIYDYLQWQIFDEFRSSKIPSDEFLMFLKGKGIVFNKQQLSAINETTNFIIEKLFNNDLRAFYTIQGKAGTGKTTIINKILENVLEYVQSKGTNLKRLGVGVCALSHKAKQVLFSKIDENLVDINKILGYSVAQLLGMNELFNEKTGTMEFKPDKKNINRGIPIDKLSILIIDEASMLGERELKLINDAIKRTGRKVAIVYLGDEGLLEPIRSSSFYRQDSDFLWGSNSNDNRPLASSNVSPIFSLASEETRTKSVLTERVRLGEESPILPFADLFWLGEKPVLPKQEDAIKTSDTKITNEGALIVTELSYDLAEGMLSLFLEAKNTLNPNLAKIVTARLKTMELYNAFVHSKLFNVPLDNKEFFENEQIVFTDNFYVDTSLGPVLVAANSTEGIIVKIDTSNPLIIYSPEIPNGIPSTPITCYTLTIKTSDKDTIKVPIVSNQDVVKYNNIIKALHTASSNMYSQIRSLLGLEKEDAKSAANKFYAAYKNFIGSVASITYNYAINIHKALGSTYEVVGVDANDIYASGGFKGETKARLLYTGITRASNITIINSLKQAMIPKYYDLKQINSDIKQSRSKEKLYIPKPESPKTEIETITPIEVTFDHEIDGIRVTIPYTYINKDTTVLAKVSKDNKITLYNIPGKDNQEKINYFIDYISGKIPSITSKLKELVFNKIEAMGYTKEFIKSVISSPKDIYTILLLLGHSHIINNDKENYDKSNLESDTNVLIEYRALSDALNQYLSFKGKNQPNTSVSKVEFYDGKWTRAEVEKDKNRVYLFGDNTNDRLNTHHVPTSTQAVIRGLDNAIGIDTKKDRGTNQTSYFTNTDFGIFKAQVDEAIAKAKATGKTIVIPADGIGTGKALLEQRAPKLFNYLQDQLNSLKNIEEEKTYEVSTAGDKRFSALVATFKPGTIVEGEDVGGKTIEEVYQKVIKKSGKGKAPAKNSILNLDIEEFNGTPNFILAHQNGTLPEMPGDLWFLLYNTYSGSYKDLVGEAPKITKEDKEEFSYYVGYLPLWKEWAKQNPELIDDLRLKSQGKTLTDKFATTRVSLARALTDILQNKKEKFHGNYINNDLTFFHVVSKGIFRGQEQEPIIDDKGNLHIHTRLDTLGKMNSLSFSTDPFIAEEYGERYSSNPYIIYINNSYLDKILPKEEYNRSKIDAHRNFRYEEEFKEIRLIFNEEIVIPKGEFLIYLEEYNYDFKSLKDIISYIGSSVAEADLANIADSMNFSEIDGRGSFDKYNLIVLYLDDTFGEIDGLKVSRLLLTIQGGGLTFYDGLRTEDVEKAIKLKLLKRINTFFGGKIVAGERLIEFFNNHSIHADREESQNLPNIINVREENLLLNSTVPKKQNTNIGNKTLNAGETLITKNSNSSIEKSTYFTTEKSKVLNPLFSDSLNIEINDLIQIDNLEDEINKLIYSLLTASLINFPEINLKTLEVIELLRKKGFYYTSSVRKITAGKDLKLISKAKKLGMNYNKETDTIDVPSLIFGFTENELRIMDERDNLVSSTLFTPSELRSLSKAAIFKLSDFITMLNTDKSSAEILLGEEYKDVDLTLLPRIELIKSVGLNKLFEVVKERIFNSDVRASEIDNLDTLDKLDFIYDNFDAFISYAYDALVGLEEIALNNSTDIRTDIDNIFNTEDEAEILEIYGNSVEHWQVGFRLVSAFSSLSLMIKRFLEKAYELDSNGNQILNLYGLAKTINPLKAVALILNWTQYAENIDQMIDMIELHIPKNPWAKQVVDKLNSDDELFKSLFFVNFKKYFLLYTITYMDNNGKILTKAINKNVYSELIFKEIKSRMSSFALNNFNLLTKEGLFNTEVFEKLKQHISNFKAAEAKSLEAIGSLIEICDILHIPLPDPLILLDIITTNKENPNNPLLARLDNLITTIQDSHNYTELLKNIKRGGEYENIVKMITKTLGDSFEAVSYEAGKLYYSYIMPSYINKLIGKLKGHTEDFELFMETEFKLYPWFYDKETEKFRNVWLLKIYSDPLVRENLEHVASLHFNDTNYVDKTPVLYVASMVSNYFYDEKNKKYAYYRMTIMSNKPSEEYIKFIRYSEGYEDTIVKHLTEFRTGVFWQEIDRIKAVNERKDSLLDDKAKIKYFDNTGNKFHYLSFLNDYLDPNTEKGKTKLGEAIREVADYKKIPSTSTISEISINLKKAVKDAINELFNLAYEYWKSIGYVIEGKDLKGLIETRVAYPINNKNSVKESLKEFFWNDYFASIEMSLIFTTDIAYYGNAENLQKRLAELHAPGARVNILAKDSNGISYSDGKFRTMYISDLEIKSNLKRNLEIVFDELKALIVGNDPLAEKARKILDDKLKYLKKSLDKVNATDALGYSSLTSNRKKLGLLGKWDSTMEEVYEKIKLGDFSELNLNVLWLPIKPFVYSLIRKDGHNNSLSSIKVGVQNKNSEYTLMLVDAILKAGNRPNILTALYEFMEESLGLTKDKDGKWTGTPNGKGIDTILFESTVKVGLSGIIDINDCTSIELIKSILNARLYNEDKTYNTTYVHEMPFEDWAELLENPAHFKGKLAHGSLDRALTFTDMEYYKDPETKEEYHITVNGKDKTVREAKADFDDAVADNVLLSFEELIDRFKLNTSNKKLRNIALSRILQDVIIKDSRFGPDMLWACSVNKNGEFNIPLSDIVQSNRILLLLNSIIKNSINKQEIAGGPVVLVTSYGTSRELAIRFKNKEGKILLTEKEFNDYTNKDKKGIKELLFLSKSEDKIKKTYLLPEEGITYDLYLRDNLDSVAYFECFAPIYDDNLFNDFKDKNGNINIEKIEKENPDLLKMIGYRIPTEAKYSMVPIKIVGFLPRNAGEGIMLPYEITWLSGSDFDVDKLYIMRYSFERKIDRVNPLNVAKEYLNTNKVSLNSVQEIEGYIEKVYKGIIDENDSEYTQFKLWYKEHEKDFIVGKYTRSEKRRDKNNNLIIDSLYGVLTSHQVLDQFLTPGNFDELKKLGYLVLALQTEYSNNEIATHLQAKSEYDELKNKSIDDLKDLGYKDKNLMFNHIQSMFHALNMVAAKLIGIFAQANVSHGFISMYDCFISIPNELAFTINDHTINGDSVKIDPIRNFEGKRISSVLASLLAASVDAVKDPVLNLLNINIATANVVTTLIRLGFSLETVSLLMSLPIIKNLVKDYLIASASKFVDLETFTNLYIEKTAKKLKTNSNDLSNFNFTDDVMKETLLDDSLEEPYILSYLKLFGKVTSISKSFSEITHMTRYNSITSAVGPTAAATYANEIKENKFWENKILINENNGTIILAVNNPILKSFREFPKKVERALLGDNLILASPMFREALERLNNILGYMNTEIADKFSDFFMSFYINLKTLNREGVFDLSYAERKKYITDYPNLFLIKKEEHKGNLLIDSIVYNTSEREVFPFLELQTRNLLLENIEDLKKAWVELYRVDKECAMSLIKYNFFRGSLGFNPKTFSRLIPNELKAILPNYVLNLLVDNTITIAPHVLNSMIVLFRLNNNLINNKTIIYDANDELHSNGVVIHEEKENYLVVSLPKVKQYDIVVFKKSFDDPLPKLLYAAFPDDSIPNGFKAYFVEPLGHSGQGFEIETNFEEAEFISPKTVFPKDTIEELKSAVQITENDVTVSNEDNKEIKTSTESSLLFEFDDINKNNFNGLLNRLDIEDTEDKNNLCGPK